MAEKKHSLSFESVDGTFIEFTFDEDQLDIFFDDNLVTLNPEQVDLLFMFLGNYNGKI